MCPEKIFDLKSHGPGKCAFDASDVALQNGGKLRMFGRFGKRVHFWGAEG
jgi:hypothetical protein